MIKEVYECAKESADAFKEVFKKDKTAEFLDKLYKMRKEVDPDISVEEFVNEFIAGKHYKHKE